MSKFLETDYVFDTSGKLTSTGSADAYILTVSQQIGGYYQGLELCFKANFTNAGTATVNVRTQSSPSGLGAVTLKKGAGASNLAAGDIVSGGFYTIKHDGTNFQVLELNGTVAAGSIGTAALADDSVTNAKLANMAQSTIKGRAVGAGTGDPTDLTPAQATAILDAFTSALKGLVPASGGGTTTFLRADATFAAPVTITAGTALATTSGTEFDFTGLPANLRRITIIFDRVSLSGTDNLLVQIGDAGGLETTGYTCVSEFEGSLATSTAGFVVRTAVASRSFSGHMTLTRVTSDTWVSSHAGGDDQTGAASSVGGGRKGLSEDLDRVRITRTGTNTFDLGQVNILYEAS
jgi:hypothetical protein